MTQLLFNEASSKMVSLEAVKKSFLRKGIGVKRLRYGKGQELHCKSAATGITE